MNTAWQLERSTPRTNRTSFPLAGTTPLAVRTLWVNIANTNAPVTWLTETNWQTTVNLAAGVNAITVEGRNAQGSGSPATWDSITITNQ